MARGLARLALQAGQSHEALRHLRRSLRDLPAQPEALWDLANMLIDLSQLEEARRVISRIDASGAALATACLQGRLAMRQRAWDEACRILQEALPNSLRWPELNRDLNCLLAECHAHLGNPDQQLQAYRAALESDPQWSRARRGYAAALLALGMTERAVEEYRKLVTRDPRTRRELIRALLLHNKLLPAAERQWGEIDRLFGEVPAKPKAALETQPAPCRSSGRSGTLQRSTAAGTDSV